jgi:hypothetical protein
MLQDGPQRKSCVCTHFFQLTESTKGSFPIPQLLYSACPFLCSIRFLVQIVLLRLNTKVVFHSSGNLLPIAKAKRPEYAPVSTAPDHDAPAMMAILAIVANSNPKNCHPAVLPARAASMARKISVASFNCAQG